MRLYTWKDVERSFLKKQKQWKSSISAVDVYPDEVIVYLKAGTSREDAMTALCSIFPKNINAEDSCIKLDREDNSLKITFEMDAEPVKKINIPLFKQVIYNESAYPEEALEELACPVVVFHSYKGGVGRTLSLLAFAHAWTNIPEKKETEKLLIIDSDIEAPGLSWIQGERDENAFSYLDLLTLIQDERDADVIVDTAVEKMGSLSISIETEKRKVQHIFLPTFRYDEQVFDLYASPDSVVKGRNREYILAEILAKVAVRLGASMVLIDLRAGISEYSAPLLFDPRVKKYLVTSTSSQSVVGTGKLLKYVANGLKITEDSNLPTILLSMVPDTLPISEKDEIIRQLTKCFDVNDENAQLLDNMVIELPFASELVHLTDLKQIFGKLKGRAMYGNIEQMVNQSYKDQDHSKGEYTETQRQEILKQIHTYANQQITAEANGAVELLLTQPIKNLCARYNGQIPASIVRGTKGSGKTFLYRQFLTKQSWSSFCNSVDEKYKDNEEGLFLPVFAPRNVAQLSALLKNCIDRFNAEIPFAEVSKSVYIDNSQKLEEQSEKETNWMDFWEKLFVSSVDEKLGSFDELSAELKKTDRKIVFLLDGLEEILRGVSANPYQQKAVQVLCQDIVNLLSARYENIGIIVFLRNDMAQNAITVNYEQFIQAHGYADLRWTSEEALKLAVWVVSQAVEGYYESEVPIEDTSKEVIDKHLEKLWGLKLGKDNSNEAYSSRWILAALSDFNGQLQARDIIRFLKYAAQPNAKKAAYEDRILMPAEIRNAVSTCSQEKIKEIKDEYETLKPILEKLEQLSPEKKVLPLRLGNDALTSMEEKLMMQEGYLTRDGDKLYFPEIIRHALGFKYEKGARPRVLSLLLKH